MTFVVPFDGSALAAAALVRATEFSRVLDERVLAVAAVPERNVEYARERGWIGPNEPFDRDAVVETLRDRVAELAPEADFRHVLVDRHAPPGTIASRLRRVARDVDATMVFVGSEDAGRLVTSISSVGGSVASEDAYDVVLVRNRRRMTATAADGADR